MEKLYKLNKLIGYYIILTVSIYFCVYIVLSFCWWDFKNPFQWIINLPTYDFIDRFFIIFLLILYNVLANVIIRAKRKLK